MHWSVLSSAKKEIGSNCAAGESKCLGESWVLYISNTGKLGVYDGEEFICNERVFVGKKNREFEREAQLGMDQETEHKFHHGDGSIGEN